MAAAIIDKYFPKEKYEDMIYSHTAEQKLISEYTGLDFNEIMDLPYSLYFLYRHDAWVDRQRKTEDGREFLQTLWRLKQTKPDLDAVREMMRGDSDGRRN